MFLRALLTSALIASSFTQTASADLAWQKANLVGDWDDGRADLHIERFSPFNETTVKVEYCDREIYEKSGTLGQCLVRGTTRMSYNPRVDAFCYSAEGADCYEGHQVSTLNPEEKVRVLDMLGQFPGRGGSGKTSFQKKLPKVDSIVP